MDAWHPLISGSMGADTLSRSPKPARVAVDDV
jgi:hypothetical protein